MEIKEAAILSSYDKVTQLHNIRYFDKNGTEIVEGDKVKFDIDHRRTGGRIEQVYKSVDGHLGVDATNKVWLENGRAYPCQYGIYPFNMEDLRSCVKYVEE